MIVKVGEGCRKCKYFGGEWTGACNYCLVEHKSRIYTKGKRTVKEGYCDKFVEGRVTYDATRWKNKGVIRKNG